MLFQQSEQLTPEFIKRLSRGILVSRAEWAIREAEMDIKKMSGDIGKFGPDNDARQRRRIALLRKRIDATKQEIARAWAIQL